MASGTRRCEGCSAGDTGHLEVAAAAMMLVPCHVLPVATTRSVRHPYDCIRIRHPGTPCSQTGVLPRTSLDQGMRPGEQPGFGQENADALTRAAPLRVPHLRMIRTRGWSASSARGPASTAQALACRSAAQLPASCARNEERTTPGRYSRAMPRGRRMSPRAWHRIQPPPGPESRNAATLCWCRRVIGRSNTSKA